MKNPRFLSPSSYKYTIFFLLLVLLTPLTLKIDVTHSIKGATSTDVTLYFHYSPENNLSKNQSIYVFSGASSLQPNKATATQIVLKTNIRFPYSGITAWIAYISWFTGPLQSDYHLKGTVDIEVWMNSVDSISLFGGSGYGAGVIDLDENTNLVWNTSLSYKFGVGKIISNNPSLYKFTIENVDHLFSKGHTLGFIIGIGSTKQAWEVNVYFDSPSMNSRAVIPVDSLVFGNASSISCMVNPVTIPLGASITIRGQLQPSQANQKIILRFLHPQGNTESKTTTTLSNGTYLYTYKPDQFGVWHVTASWEGNVNYPGSTSQTELFAVTTSTKKSLIISILGSGTTDPLPSVYVFNKSEIVVIRSLANTGWSLDDWLIDGSPSSSTNSISLSMDSDHILTAVFTEKITMDPWAPLFVDFLAIPVAVILYLMMRRGILFKHIVQVLV